MIDTLKIRLTEYNITDENKLLVQPALLDLSSGEPAGGNEFDLFKYKGKLVRGKKAFYNDDKLNLTITGFKPPENVVNIDGVPISQVVSTKVQFSVPKVVNEGDNYNQTDLQGTMKCIEQIEKHLQDNVGLKTDLLKSEVSRIDTFRNIETDEPVKSYYNVLKLLEMSRTNKREYGGTTFLMENSQQEFCIYDKRQEMLFNDKDISGVPENVYRFEQRLLNSKKIKSCLPIETTRDLLENYQELSHFYTEAYGKVFKFEPEDVEVLCAEKLEHELEVFKEKSGRYWVADYLQYVGLVHLTGLADIDVIKGVFERVAGNRQTAYRVFKKLDKLNKDLQFSKVAEMQNKKQSDLYNELKQKLLTQIAV